MEWDKDNELVNTMLNTQATLIVLESKGIMSAEEFKQAKEEAERMFKENHPQLFEEEK